MTFEELFSFQNLNDAFYESSKKNNWKEAVQRYQSNLLVNNVKLMRELHNGTYQQSKTHDFTIYERGKLREIRSPAIRDRIVQKIICKYILVPQLTCKLIYDNYACVKKRGTDMSRRRINFMLQKYVKQHGTDGYIVQVDVRKYFDSIPHEKLKEMLHKAIKVDDSRIMDLIDYLIDHMIHKDGEWQDRGLNLGSEIPQILSSFYMSPVDNFVKCVKGAKCYARYADDIIAVVPTKDEAKELLGGIREQLTMLGLELNEAKTRIAKLSDGFTFLKIKYSVDKSFPFQIIRRLAHDKLYRAKKKVRDYKRLFDNGILTYIEAQNSFKSIICKLRKESNRCYSSVGEIAVMYTNLFGDFINVPKRKRQRLIVERMVLT